MSFEFFVLNVYISFSFFLSVLIYLISYILVPRVGTLSKLSTYECGFEPFGDTKVMFDVRFYLVAILFIIFDVEVMFLFPWVLVLNKIGSFGYITMLFFLLILGIGFFYEWLSGALDW